MFHIKLGLTSPIEIKHQHMMNNLSVHKWFPQSDKLPQVGRVLQINSPRKLLCNMHVLTVPNKNSYALLILDKSFVHIDFNPS